jgi:iron complex transport system permease protein
MVTGRARRKRTKKGALVTGVLFLLLLAAFVGSASMGYTRLSLDDVAAALIGNGTSDVSLIVFQFRMPRIVVALSVGASLAVSGCVLQGVSRNALADPGILGINAGAGLCVMLYLSFFREIESAPVYGLPAAALLGAGAAAFVIYALAFRPGEGTAPIRLVLNGIGVAAGIGAAMILLTIRMDPEKYLMASMWMAGGIWGTSWDFAKALLPWTMLLIPYVLRKSAVLDVMSLGDAAARGLGVRMELPAGIVAAAIGAPYLCICLYGRERKKRLACIFCRCPARVNFSFGRDLRWDDERRKEWSTAALE